MAYITQTQLKQTLDKVAPEKRKEALKRIVSQGHQIEGMSGSEKKPAPTPAKTPTRAEAVNQLGGLIKNLPKTLPKIATKAAVKGTLSGINKLADVSRTADKITQKREDVTKILQGSPTDKIIESIPGIGQMAQGQRVAQQMEEYQKGQEVTPGIAGGISSNIKNQAFQGLETTGRGVVDLANAASALGQAPLKLIDQAMGREANVAQVGAQGLYNIKAKDAALLPLEKTWRGASKIVLGGAQFAGAPVGGVVEEGIQRLPEPMKKGVAWLVKQPPDFIKSVALAINPNLTEEQINENILNPLGAAASVVGVGKLKSLKTVNKAEKTFEKTAKIARKMGFEEADLSQIKNIPVDLQATAQKYLEAARRKKLSPRNEEGAFATAGRDLETIINKAEELLSSKGKTLGDLRKTDLAEKTVTQIQKQKDAFQKFLKEDLNVKIEPRSKSFAGEILDEIKGTSKKGDVKLNFENSRISGNAAAIKKFEELFELLKKKNINARDLEARTGQINELTGLLKQSGFSASEANTMLNKAKTFVDEAVGTVAPEFKGLKIDYAKVAKELKRLKTAAKVGTGDLSISSGEQVLRRYLGNAGRKYEKAIDSAERLANKLGLDEGKSLREKAALADMIEHYTETFNPQSLQGNMRKFSKIALEKVPVVGKPLSAIGEFVGAEVNAKRVNTILNDLIKKSPQGKKGNINIPKMSKSGVSLVLTQLLNNSMPKTTPQKPI